MKANDEMLEDKLKNYEGQLRGLNSYIKELKDKSAEHGTHPEHYEKDLLEAEHNVMYYEGEMARVKGLIDKEPDGVTYLVYKDASEEWRWQLRAGNNNIIADSGEGYRNKQDCLHAITLVKSSKDASVKERE